MSGFSSSKTFFKSSILQKLKGESKSQNLFFRCHLLHAGRVLHRRITSCQRDSKRLFTSCIYVSIHQALLTKSLMIKIFSLLFCSHLFKENTALAEGIFSSHE
jgi:hypothetical protein